MAIAMNAKIPIHILPANEFGGEYERTDNMYQSFLERVSAEARIKNISEAESRLVELKRSGKNGVNLHDILHKMGRDPEHFSSIHVDGTSPLCHAAKIGAAGFRALDIFYNWNEKYAPNLGSDANGELARKWIGGMENRQAVTNRKKIVVHELVKAIGNVVDGEVVRIFSLAGGDSQVVIEAIKKSDRKVSVFLVDPDRDALNAAKKNAEAAGLSDSFTVKRGLHSSAKKLAMEFRPHIFDVVGLMDYLPDEKVIEVVSIARDSICEGGTLITGNIINNKERVFLEDVLLWFMTYREPEELGELILKGGFSSDRVKIICEPFRIHGIAVCRK
ncbi:MAG: class I SAM-dependent methyltransferase family protein [Candidatus Moranbacteria bacterium]|jgi:hypothetical protein|nr:class I SAM-dependent methyltransferase family protein [Candidatus Moranbacteria bacterium]MDX9856150.1 class I SAM-dependent methyltransferase family protein [Candidatus Moranbacteria bacterium]